MEEVILLDDSSDEETTVHEKNEISKTTLDATVRNAARVSLDSCDLICARRSAAASGSSNNSNKNKSGVVDLLDSSDEDGDNHPVGIARSSVACNFTTTRGKPTLQELYKDGGDESDSDDSILQTQISFAKKAPEETVIVDVTTTVSTTKRVSLSQTSSTSHNRLPNNAGDYGYQPDTENYCEMNHHSMSLPIECSKEMAATSRATSENTKGSASSHIVPSSKASPAVNPYRKETLNTFQTPGSSSSKATAAHSSASCRTPLICNPYSTDTTKVVEPTHRSGSTATHASSLATTTKTLDRSSLSSHNKQAEFIYPTLLSRSKQYEDVRARYLLAFWKSARSLTHYAHDRPKLDHSINKIVQLALWPYPLRSLEEFMLRGKTGGSACGGSSVRVDRSRYEALQAQLNKGNVDKFNVPADVSRDGRYCSIAEACLVAMYQEIHRRIRNSKQPSTSHQQNLSSLLASKEMRISLQELIPAIEKRLQPFCPGRILRKKEADGGVAYYTSERTRSAEYAQILKLKVTCRSHDTETNEGYLKVRKQNKQHVFELTRLGYRTAEWILKRTFPAPPGHYRTSHIETLGEVSQAYKGICLAMDNREGGQRKFIIHDMCNRLDWKKMPYFVGSLDIGDYAFFSTKPGQNNLLCPILVERKSIQDVAGSIADGRWKNQKHRMYHGQFVFGYGNCRIAYIIEGKEEKQQVSGGYIGHRKYDVDRERLNDAIEGLRSEGFDVLRTTSLENSMLELARWAEKIAEDVRSGKLKLQYTYEEFKAEVRKIPPQTDFSRLARDYMAQRLERERKQKAKEILHCGSPTSDSRTTSVSPIQHGTSSRVKVCSAAVQSNDMTINLCDSDDSGTGDETRKHADRALCKGQKAQENVGPCNQITTELRTGVVLKTLASSPGDTTLLESNNRGRSDDGENKVWLCDESHAWTGHNARRTCTADNKRGRQEEKKRRNELAQKEKRQKTLPTTSCLSPVDLAETKSVACKSECPANDGAVSGISRDEDYVKWSMRMLQKQCFDLGLAKTGTKEELIDRLKGPKPPKLWVERKRTKRYAPKHNTGGTALLVALYLHEREQSDPNAPGMTKPELYVKAEGLQVTKNPFSGGTTQTGPHHYDGWNSMSKLIEGNPPLVAKMKYQRFKLTRGFEWAGFEFAKALHEWCHEHGNCHCGEI